MLLKLCGRAAVVTYLSAGGSQGIKRRSGSQAVRQGSAKPSTAVRLRSGPHVD